MPTRSTVSDFAVWDGVTRIPGVAALTAGPGVTNGMSAMAAAQQNQSPLVVLGGRAPALRWGQRSYLAAETDADERREPGRKSHDQHHQRERHSYQHAEHHQHYPFGR